MQNGGWWSFYRDEMLTGGEVENQNRAQIRRFLGT